MIQANPEPSKTSDEQELAVYFHSHLSYAIIGWRDFLWKIPFNCKTTIFWPEAWRRTIYGIHEPWTSKSNVLNQKYEPWIGNERKTRWNYCFHGQIKE